MHLNRFDQSHRILLRVARPYFGSGYKTTEKSGYKTVKCNIDIDSEKQWQILLNITVVKMFGDLYRLFNLQW